MRIVKNHKRDSEKGSSLLELSIIAPLLILMAFGLVELGMAWNSQVTVQSAARLAVRSAASMGGDRYADRVMVESLVAALTPRELHMMDKVIIYRVKDDGEVPSECLDWGTQGLCNRYKAAHLRHVDDDHRWGCGLRAHDGKWCPNTRISTSADPMYVGVYLEMQHDWITGILPFDPPSFSYRTVMRINPLRPHTDGDDE